MKNEYQCPKCACKLNSFGLFEKLNYLEVGANPSNTLEEFKCRECGYNIYPHYKAIKDKKYLNNKKKFLISFGVFMLCILLLLSVASSPSPDTAATSPLAILLLLGFIALAITAIYFVICCVHVMSSPIIKTLDKEYLSCPNKETPEDLNKQKIEQEESTDNVDTSSCQCPNCNNQLSEYEIFSSKDYAQILQNFTCPECGFNIYPHYRKMAAKGMENNKKIFVVSVWTFVVLLVLVLTPNLPLPDMFIYLFFGSIIFLFITGFSKKHDKFFKNRLDRLDKLYTDTDLRNNYKSSVQTANGATDFIDNLIKNQGIHFNRFLSYPVIENNISIDESLKNTLPEYVKQRIIETGKGDLECLVDESVSTVKKLIFDDYHIDMAVIDEEIAQLYECIPAKINVLRDALEPAQNEILTKTELREEVQYNLIAVNNFYSIQISEAKKILDFGVKEYCQYNFEDDIKILDNLKFYPDFKVDFDTSDYQEKYNSNQKEAVEFFVSRVLNNSAYPIYIKKEFELEYNPDNGILALNYKLPNIEEIPNISEVSYISAKNDFKVTKLKEKGLNELYDGILYQIALRANYEIFKSDKASHIQSIVFNGYLEYVDKADGKYKIACILSMKADKHEFLDVNLSNVEPKQCFKKFKGIGSNNLYNIIPVRPIINLNKADRRFIEGYEVMKDIEKGDNLCCMDWRAYENLVRELFEKEFSDKNGEVKITQSSRDGGVDAVVFLDDYLTGGKIIIQAKRYTNVVGVSAVRDLYGTMEHENAMRGIIITTSYYGSDSYEFAKEKRITLLNGDDLLNLLAKHGHTHARIDIEEAKALQKQQEAK